MIGPDFSAVVARHRAYFRTGATARPSPFGLYVFAEDQQVAEQILDSTTSGDAAVNDCTIQPLIPDLPFGGVGNSGMGKYHGEWGFRGYTNARGVLYHGVQIDPDLRYPPYGNDPATAGIRGR